MKKKKQNLVKNKEGKKTNFKPVVNKQSSQNTSCDCCNRHISELKPFGGSGDPLRGDFSEELLVKRYRDLTDGGGATASWECRDCICLEGAEYYRLRFKEENWDGKMIKANLAHLKRVKEEIKKIEKEYHANPAEVGDFEHRLYWAIRGVDPRKSKCTKHNTEIIKNNWGEFICGKCIEDDYNNEVDTFDENNWFDPDNQPPIRVKGIRFGNKLP
jgi:hypothetical protein